MTTEVENWNRVAGKLGISMVAPCDLVLADGKHIYATAHLKEFGAKNGMVVDPDYDVIKPFAESLVKSGYGCSAVELGASSLDRDDLSSIIEMLADWGWSSEEPAPAWLPPPPEEDIE